MASSPASNERSGSLGRTLDHFLRVHSDSSCNYYQCLVAYSYTWVAAFNTYTLLADEHTYACIIADSERPQLAAALEVCTTVTRLVSVCTCIKAMYHVHLVLRVLIWWSFILKMARRCLIIYQTSVIWCLSVSNLMVRPTLTSTPGNSGTMHHIMITSLAS